MLFSVDACMRVGFFYIIFLLLILTLNKLCSTHNLYTAQNWHCSVKITTDDIFAVDSASSFQMPYAIQNPLLQILCIAHRHTNRLLHSFVGDVFDFMQ